MYRVIQKNSEITNNEYKLVVRKVNIVISIKNIINIKVESDVVRKNNHTRINLNVYC